MENAAEILSQTNFTTVDWVIVICYPLISVVIGVVASRYISSMTDFVTAGQSLGTCLGVATLTGTELGLITVMYSAQKGFTGAFAAFHIALVAGVVTFFIGVTGFLVYRLRAMEVLTIPEFYKRRFGRKTQILGGVMMAFGGILNMGLFLKVGSMFLVGITGMSDQNLPLPEEWGLPAIDALSAVMAFLLLLVLIYTCLGGMISVVLADYVQFVVLSFGLLLTTCLAIYKLGWTHIFTAIENIKGPAGFDPTISEGGFGVEYIIWMGFLGLIGCSVWPTSVARALSAESPKTVKKQFMLASISYLIRFLIPYFWGTCALVFIMTHDAQLKELFFPAGGGAEGVDNLYAMPIFLGRILPPVIIGIISAGMVAAFMSTHDSYLLCWSSVLTQDVVAPLFGDRLGPRVRIWLTRLFIILIGIYVYYWGMIYEGNEDVWDYMAVTGAIYFTGAFALLGGGLYWKRASSTGAVLALLAGSSAVIGLTPVQDSIGHFFTHLAGSIPALQDVLLQIPGVSVDEANPNVLNLEIPSARVGLTSIAATLGAMILGSLIFPDKKKQPSESPQTT